MSLEWWVPKVPTTPEEEQAAMASEQNLSALIQAKVAQGEVITPQEYAETQPWLVGYPSEGNTGPQYPGQGLGGDVILPDGSKLLEDVDLAGYDITSPNERGPWRANDAARYMGRSKVSEDRLIKEAGLTWKDVVNGLDKVLDFIPAYKIGQIASYPITHQGDPMPLHQMFPGAKTLSSLLPEPVNAALEEGGNRSKMVLMIRDTVTSAAQGQVVVGTLGLSVLAAKWGWPMLITWLQTNKLIAGGKEAAQESTSGVVTALNELTAEIRAMLAFLAQDKEKEGGPPTPAPPEPKVEPPPEPVTEVDDSATIAQLQQMGLSDDQIKALLDGDVRDESGNLSITKLLQRMSIFGLIKRSIDTAGEVLKAKPPGEPSKREVSGAGAPLDKDRVNSECAALIKKHVAKFGFSRVELLPRKCREQFESARTELGGSAALNAPQRTIKSE